VVVEGIVVAEPDARDTYTNLRAEVDRLIISDQTGGLRAGFCRF